LLLAALAWLQRRTRPQPRHGRPWAWAHTFRRPGWCAGAWRSRCLTGCPYSRRDVGAWPLREIGGRGLPRHGSTVVGQPVFGAARHVPCRPLLCPSPFFSRAYVVRAVADGLHGAGFLTHEHTRIRASRWFCAHRRTWLNPTDRMRARRLRQDAFAAHGGIVLARLRPFEPARRGGAPPPTGRLTRSGCFWGPPPCAPAHAAVSRMTLGAGWDRRGFTWMCTCTMLALGQFPAHRVCLQTDKRTNISCEQATPLESF